MVGSFFGYVIRILLKQTKKQMKAIQGVNDGEHKEKQHKQTATKNKKKLKEQY